MSDVRIIVAFKDGTTEDQARADVEACGGHVKRRMRTDRPEQVQLLGVFAEDARGALQAKPAVDWTELDSEHRAF